ncbi:hypothetical protein [Nonomuraea rhodomycinica]|uniref:Lipoprotein n=1 Tax=Nonomuraea rhodomycinica TaxID=1712872 RepID=A0A7Y6ITV1_9ACTN|nr:hypothetical protein [Nonomuraea rhodomycinica]NUW44287.1 hypothetical protein [Nonomuraea rhodomycinica]
MTTLPRLAASALLVGLVAACSSGGAGAGGGQFAAGVQQGGAKAAAPAKIYTVEQLAAKVGCKPKMQVDAADIRTGYCKTKVGEFFVNTFSTEEGKDEWMDRAPEYNPHLVGPRWTVLSSLKVLRALQKPLNGDLHLKDHRTKSPTPSPPAADDGGDTGGY